MREVSCLRTKSSEWRLASVCCKTDLAISNFKMPLLLVSPNCQRAIRKLQPNPCGLSRGRLNQPATFCRLWFTALRLPPLSTRETQILPAGFRAVKGPEGIFDKKLLRLVSGVYSLTGCEESKFRNSLRRLELYVDLSQAQVGGGYIGETFFQRECYALFLQSSEWATRSFVCRSSRVRIAMQANHQRLRSSCAAEVPTSQRTL
ncbi:hypothetical protein Pan181_17100 [Aeoliella mucimassa]|uniref:Uncharacterized protein n=1 Tax=Aeoliella mucimassa TaxID=2527972 RepID=A0A518ALB4_9BACT|nr:hypothetical protein Pan181_17100 [Aeoliella mucimassa]